MSAQFKVGDIVVGCNFVIDTQYNGMECEITSPLWWHRWINPDGSTGGGLCYGVAWADDRLRHPYLADCVYPHNLRKKHPPRSAKSIMREAILKAKQPSKVPA
jgi:hypothetical protein